MKIVIDSRKWAAASLAALMLTTLAACSNEKEPVDETTANKGFQLRITGYLDKTGTQTRGAGAQWEDENGVAGGGLKFKWTNENTAEMYAGYYQATPGEFLGAYNGNGAYHSKVNITINEQDPAKATLESAQSFIPGESGSLSESDHIICFAPVSNTGEIQNAPGFLTFPMSFPTDFTQVLANSTTGIRETMYIYGQANLKGGNLGLSPKGIAFRHIPATVRYVIKNRRGADTTIKSIRMSFDSNVLPTTGSLKWSVLEDENHNHILSSPEQVFTTGRTNSVTTWLGAEKAGLSVTTANPLLGYAVVAPSQEEVTGNVTFTLTDKESHEYLSAVIPAEQVLAKVTKQNKFLSGYVYTVTLLLDDKLTVGDVTVNGWEQVNGGEVSNGSLNLTSWCKDDTYKTQREALTILTLDGPSITSTELTSYMQGNLATYFPNVTIVHFTGKTIAQASHFVNSKVTTVLGDAESIGSFLFKRNYPIKELSFPKLKAFNRQILFGVSVTNVCFASLTDFTKIDQEFTTNNINLAFGATEEFTFGNSSKPTPNYIFGGNDNGVGLAASTTLYLNENGYEYKNKVDLAANTWRGVTFKEIKKYSEYPGKKD